MQYGNLFILLFVIGKNFLKIQLNIIKCTNKELIIIEFLFDRLKINLN